MEENEKKDRSDDDEGQIEREGKTKSVVPRTVGRRKSSGSKHGVGGRKRGSSHRSVSSSSSEPSFSSLLKKCGYRYVRNIGQGSFGVVTLVKRKLDGSLFTAKIVRPKKKHSTGNSSKIKHEAEFLATFRHPNILSFVESFEERGGGRIIIVTEYCENGDIAAQISRAREENGEPLNRNTIMKWFVQTALALRFLHDSKVLHRDVKPSNIFLTRNATVVKLGDLGNTKMLEHSLEMATTAVGTPYYMSPELARGEEYNEKSDIWALGCVLYEMLSLKRPYEAAGLAELIFKIATDSPPKELDFKVCRPNSSVRRLVDGMLQKDPKSRPKVSQILRNPACVDAARSFVREYRRTRSPDDDSVESDVRASKTSAGRVARLCKSHLRKIEDETSGSDNGATTMAKEDVDNSGSTLDETENESTTRDDRLDSFGADDEGDEAVAADADDADDGNGILSTSSSAMERNRRALGGSEKRAIRETKRGSKSPSTRRRNGPKIQHRRRQERRRLYVPSSSSSPPPPSFFPATPPRTASRFSTKSSGGLPPLPLSPIVTDKKGAASRRRRSGTSAPSPTNAAFRRRVRLPALRRPKTSPSPTTKTGSLEWAVRPGSSRSIHSEPCGDSDVEVDITHRRFSIKSRSRRGRSRGWSEVDEDGRNGSDRESRLYSSTVDSLEWDVDEPSRGTRSNERQMRAFRRNRIPSASPQLRQRKAPSRERDCSKESATSGTRRRQQHMISNSPTLLRRKDLCSGPGAWRRNSPRGSLLPPMSPNTPKSALSSSPDDMEALFSNHEQAHADGRTSRATSEESSASTGP